MVNVYGGKEMGEVREGGHLSISPFSKLIWILCYVLDTVSETGYTVENNMFFCPYGTYILVGEDRRSINK